MRGLDLLSLIPINHLKILKMYLQIRLESKKSGYRKLGVTFICQYFRKRIKPVIQEEYTP